MLVQNTIKYFVAGLLAFANFTGLFVINKLHEDSKTVKEPPSTLVVLDPEPGIEEVNTAYEELPEHHDQANVLVGYGIAFKHGDISWLPMLAKEAGWPEHTWEKLGQIVLRESGGCPNRRGGDIVDKNCNVTGVSEWNHRSDTGLLQINGVNYNIKRNKWAAVCTQMNICTQQPLLDPLTNLKAGKLLYDLSGWAPWDPCTWGPEWAHRCKQSNKAVSD
jgi:hypothetical protein